ncbi:Esterase lipoprotein LpqC [Labilithrix luteola]|uniref:Esterase lipoprotein LpqC n=1 Tax=Labilithrix luteola TaxID=1391654 RepID=A0A0K1Q4Y0_9BACT|nr:hypothetical protein [Labilithrix luteola]AKV00788.1 Esterase lipoprotein LpqC [Labilithrix luteola]
MKRAFVCAAVALAGCFAACNDATSDGGGPSGNITRDAGDSPSNPSSPNDAEAGPGDEADTAPPSPLPKVDVTTETITIDGTVREYVLAVPKSYDATRAYPLVLVLHGDGGTGPTMRALHTVDDVSGDDAIVAYPSGIGTHWDQSLDEVNNSDMHFMRDLVATLKGRYNVDLGRVFGVGYSAGGFMVNQISCRMGLFRAIASHAGGAPYPNPPPPDCSTGNLVAALVFHGTADTTVDLSSSTWEAQYWAQRVGCASTTSATNPAPCEAYDTCPADKPVEICIIPGLGHIPWAEGVKTEWAFFTALP